MSDKPTTIKIDEVEYIRADSMPEAKPNGNRCVVVVDRGWIFAGDLEEDDGRITLTRAVWVYNWREIGFDGVLANPHDSKVKIRKLDNDVDIPAGAEIFRIPVEDTWGLK